MVKNNLWRIVCLVWALVCIILVLKCQVSETAWQRSKQQLLQQKYTYTTTLSAQEVANFIKTWPKFRVFKFSKNPYFSYQTDNPEEAIDWKAKMWLTYHHWDAVRFYYVQQRIVSLLNAIDVKEQAQAVITELSSRKDSVSLQMIELQKKRMEAEQLDETEYLIIKAHEDVLRQMFKEYPY